MGTVHIIGSIAVGLVAGMTGQFFPLRTTIHLFVWIEREVSGREETWLGIWTLPGVDAILETFLIGKARIACAVLDVGDVSIELFFLADLQAVERVIVTSAPEPIRPKSGVFSPEIHQQFPFWVNTRVDSEMLS